MEKCSKKYTTLYGGIIAVIVGLILVAWPGNVLLWAVYFVGILSLLMGVLQFLGFLTRTKGIENRWRYLPITSPIAVLWGILLLARPALWVEFFMIFLGVVMLFIGVMQLVSLGRIKKSGVKVAGGYFIFPVLLLIAAGVVFFNPFATMAWLVVFVGAWIIAYGVIELFGYFSLKGADRE